MKIFNLTTETVVIHVAGGKKNTYLPEGQVASLSRVLNKYRTLRDGTTVFRFVYGGVQGVPEPQDGVSYIVSNRVREALIKRNDVLSPNCEVRDSHGRAIGYKYLIGNDC